MEKLTEIKLRLDNIHGGPYIEMHSILPITLDNCFPEVVEKTKKVINNSETYRRIFWHTFVHGQYLEIVFLPRSLLYYNTLSWKLREVWCVCFDSHCIGFVSLSIKSDTGEMHEKNVHDKQNNCFWARFKKSFYFKFTFLPLKPENCAFWW